MRLWKRISELADRIEGGSERARRTIASSARYGLLLYTVVLRAWTLFARYETGSTAPALRRALRRFDEAWSAYQALADVPECASLYCGKYLNLPGSPEVGGLGESVQSIRQSICRTINGGDQT